MSYKQRNWKKNASYDSNTLSTKKKYITTDTCAVQTTNIVNTDITVPYLLILDSMTSYPVMFISIFMKLLQTMAPRNAMEAEEQPSRGTTEVLDSVEPIKQPTLRIVWRNVILMALLHFGAIYALTLIPKSHPLTWLWCKRMVLIHPLWTT